MSDDDRDEILRLHTLWCDANLTSFAGFLEEHAHPDIVLFTGDGGVHRGLAAVLSETSFIQDDLGYEGVWMEVFEREARVFEHAAWVLYEFHLRFKLGSEAKEQFGRGTELYERHEDRWVMRAGHWSWRP